MLWRTNETLPNEPSPIVPNIVKSLIVASGSKPSRTLSVKGKNLFATLFIFIFFFELASFSDYSRLSHLYQQ